MDVRIKIIIIKKLCIQFTFLALVQLFLSFHSPLSFMTVFSVSYLIVGVVISGCSHNNNNNNNNNNNTGLLTAFP